MLTPCTNYFNIGISQQFASNVSARLKALLVACFHTGFMLSLFFTLKMEAKYFSITLVGSERIVRCYVSEKLLLV
jgi:hypothetical protein